MHLIKKINYFLIKVKQLRNKQRLCKLKLCSDQMARLFFYIWTIYNNAPFLHHFAKEGIQLLFFAKVAKFRHIWSHFYLVWQE